MEKIFKFFDLPREESAISLKSSYVELDFNITQRACARARYADGDLRGLVNSSPIDLFNKYRLANSSVIEIEEIDNAQVFLFNLQINRN